LELGNPGIGSLSFLVWSEDKAEKTKKAPKEDRIILIGPDLKKLKAKKIPFGQVIRVRGAFRDEYECYRELRDAVFDTKLKGFMVRVLPSRQTIWCRVDRESLDKGFSLAHLGAALVRSLKSISFVSSVDVIFVTSGKADLEKLKRPGEDSDQIVGALMKMVEEKSYDCDSCDYQELCDKIEELKMIRKNLKNKALTH
jgi:CO dehydrogenase/acetyl-CoA synthase beta subunit